MLLLRALLVAFSLSSFAVLSACTASATDDEVADPSFEDELREIASEPAGRPTLPDGYESLPAIEKQALLGQLIERGKYCSENDEWRTCLERFPKGGIGYYLKAIPALISLHPTFEHSSDEAPEGRRKLFHPFGVAGQAELTLDYATVPTESGISRSAPYSGLLTNGKTIPLVIRLAPGGGPRIIPGASVKFLVDGKPSRNFVAIHDLSGLPKENANYFAEDIGHIYPDVPWILKEYFKRVTRDPSHLPINHLGEITPDGQDVPSNAQSTPYELVLRPSAAIANRFPNKDNHDPRLDLMRIPPGMAVYDVMARAKETTRSSNGSARSRRRDCSPRVKAATASSSSSTRERSRSKGRRRGEATALAQTCSPTHRGGSRGPGPRRIAPRRGGR